MPPPTRAEVDTERRGHDVIAVAMGALGTPTGTRLAKHSFVAGKCDYHEIAEVCRMAFASDRRGACQRRDPARPASAQSR